ncbi:MAG: SIMPL domain-containing protein [Spongiibacteraceae bacterium]
MRRFFLISMSFVWALMAHAENMDHLNVTGTEIVQVKPDMAVLTFNVVREAKTADAAKKQVDTIAAKVLAQLKKYDSKELKIIANNLSINKNRNYQTGEIINFNVSMPFEIELYDLNLQNRLLDDLLAAGVEDLNPLAYKFRDENSAYDRAMQAALQAAKNRAEKMAAFYGRALGPVRAVEDAHFNSHSPMPMRAMMEMKMTRAAGDAGTQVMVPDHIDYSFTVYVTYSLK